TVLALYLGFCGWFGLGRRGRITDIGFATDSALQSAEPDTVHVVYASQTGFALELAQRTVEALNQAGKRALLSAIDSLHRSRLTNSRKILFVVSTTGEGDPPDHALGFVRDVMAYRAGLDGLQYAVLALGDRQY